MFPIKNFSDILSFMNTDQRFIETPFNTMILYKTEHSEFRQYILEQFEKIHHQTQNISCIIVDTPPIDWTEREDYQDYNETVGNDYKPVLNDFEIEIICRYMDIPIQALPCLVCFNDPRKFSFHCFSFSQIEMPNVNSFFDSFLEKTAMHSYQGNDFAKTMIQLRKEFPECRMFIEWDKSNLIEDRLKNAEHEIMANRINNEVDKDYSKSENVFALNGQGWFIKYRGTKKMLKNNKKIFYLACLLKFPGENLNNQKLIKMVNTYDGMIGSSNGPSMGKKEVQALQKAQKEDDERTVLNIKEDITDTSTPREFLSKEIKKNIRDDIAKLMKDLNKSESSKDMEEAEEINNEVHRITNALEVKGIKAFFKGNKHGEKCCYLKFPKITEDEEKARKNVYANINNALKDVKKRIARSLPVYIRASRTETNLCYFFSQKGLD